MRPYQSQPLGLLTCDASRRWHQATPAVQEVRGDDRAYVSIRVTCGGCRAATGAPAARQGRDRPGCGGVRKGAVLGALPLLGRSSSSSGPGAPGRGGLDARPDRLSAPAFAPSQLCRRRIGCRPKGESSRGPTLTPDPIRSTEAGMATITTTDGTEIFFKDWGSGQPIVFSHGWPLSADDWDTQMLFFLQHGFRVIAHDRRGHGRSTQTGDGHDMDHYADDLAAVTAHLDLRNAIHVGHSTGGGEAVPSRPRHGADRAAKAVLIAAVPPLMVQTAENPEGTPKSVFDDFQAQLAAGRADFYRAVAGGPF